MIDTVQLEEKARGLRRHVLEMIVAAGKGHIGGAFSCMDILTVLYHGGVLLYDPKNPRWPERDRFILSKGHAASALFAVLADAGYFDVAELIRVGQKGSMLGEHPDYRVPGVEIDSGSLGHGLGIGSGMALGAKFGGHNYKTVVLLGDGECQEGSVWEAFMFASHHKLDNLVAIIDRNRQITLNYTEDCLKLDPLDDKLRGFGWDVVTVNGHSIPELSLALSALRSHTTERPLAVIANTVKGKGVSFMEGKLKWHHGMPKPDEVIRAREELASKGRRDNE